MVTLPVVLWTIFAFLALIGSGYYLYDNVRDFTLFGETLNSSERTYAVGRIIMAAALGTASTIGFGVGMLVMFDFLFLARYHLVSWALVVMMGLFAVAIYLLIYNKKRIRRGKQKEA